MTSTERILRRTAGIACIIHHSKEDLISMKKHPGTSKPKRQANRTPVDYLSLP